MKTQSKGEQENSARTYYDAEAQLIVTSPGRPVGYIFTHAGRSYEPGGANMDEATQEQVRTHNATLDLLTVEQMKQAGRAILYLTLDTNGRYQVSTWSGGWRARAYVTQGRHNIAGTRYDATFIGPDGARWYGTQYGDNTQVLRAKRYAGQY